MVIRISWDNGILFRSSKNKYYQMLLGIQICKNRRKFLHPNIKHTNFGQHCITGRSQQRRQQLCRVAQSVPSPSCRQGSGHGDAEHWNNSCHGITCTAVPHNQLFPTHYHANRTLGPGKQGCQDSVCLYNLHFDCLVALKYFSQTASTGKVLLFFSLNGLC